MSPSALGGLGTKFQGPRFTALIDAARRLGAKDLIKAKYTYYLETLLFHLRLYSLMQSILVFCAHSDDQVLGAGATLAKYAKQGHDITVVVFSFGELTHPWLKKEYSASMRVQESKDAGKQLGLKEVSFLGLTEGKFKEEFESKKLKNKIIHLLLTKKPNKIFLHSPDDFHPDHRDVYKLITGILKEKKFAGDVYAYEVWNPVDVLKTNWPQMYVDVTDTFNIKLQALGKFKSQKVALTVLIVSVMIGAIVFGIRHDCRFAERFYKVPL